MSKPKTQAKPDLAAFRKLSVNAQIRKLRGERIERVFTIDREAVNEETRTVTLSISSEEPYERWWGIEILDHTAASIIADRLKSGAPLLVGHDTADQVGVLESYEITTDRKLQVQARFGKSARAEEVYQDVLDGIRRNTSVGYIIHDLVLEKQEGDVNTYRVTKWEPFEGSLVPVPADPTVGVGRSDDPGFQPELEKEQTMAQEKEKEAPANPAAPAVDIEAERKAAREAETKRVNDLLTLGDEYRDYDGPAIARELAANPEGTVDQFRAKMLEKMKTKPSKTAQPHEAPNDGADVRIRMVHSPLKGFTRDLQLADGRTMKAEEAAYRSGMWIAAAIYGSQKAKQWCAERGIDTEFRVMGGNTMTGGGAVVPVEMEQAIIDLRVQYGVARRLARVRPMGSDTLAIPRRTGGVTAYFFDDSSNSGPSASDKSWDQVTLSAKEVGALTRVAKSYVEDAIINVADDLAMEMAYAFAIKEDECFINGDGSSTYGGMQGLITKFEGTAYTSRITLSTNHDTFAEVDATDLALVMAGVAKYGKPGAKWLVSPTGKSLIFDRLKASAGGNTSGDLGMGVNDSYLGYAIEESESMPAGASTDYSSKVMFMFGRFDLSSSFGDRRGITVEVLRERYAELGQLGIMATERFDIVNHDIGDTSNKGAVSAGYGN